MVDTDASAPAVFISHTAADRRFADALSAAIDILFRGRVSVSYSTKRGAGAIMAGEDWFRWIAQQVTRARVTLVVLTPASVGRPWPLWEAGAVYGAALASDGGGGRRVRPLLFGVSSRDIPDPLRAANIQALAGDSSDDMKQFLQELLGDFESVFGERQEFVSAVERIGPVLQQYAAEVDDALARAPEALPAYPREAKPLANKILALAITSLQALRPSLKINGRYFHAVCEDERYYLERDEEIYHESEWFEEYGLARIDIDENLETLVTCQAYQQRTPIYRVLEPELAQRYREEVKAHIDPSQGWVLACPVLIGGGRPLGIICLYGKSPPVTKPADVSRMKRVAELICDAFARALQVAASR